MNRHGTWALPVSALAASICSHPAAADGTGPAYSFVALHHEWSKVRAEEGPARRPHGPGLSASLQVGHGWFLIGSGNWYVEPAEGQYYPRNEFATLQLGVGKAWQTWRNTHFYTTASWNWRLSDSPYEEREGQWPVVNFGLRSRPIRQLELDVRIGFDPVVSADDVGGLLGIHAGGHFYISPALALGMELKFNPKLFDDYGSSVRLLFRYDFSSRY
jgi:hypothetical protein